MSLLDFLFGPKDRTPTLGRAAEPRVRLAETSDLILYHFASCPFCVRVRRALERLGVQVEQRDIRRSREHYDELLRGGGRTQVPCLRIESEDGGVEWLYESAVIVRYLEKRFVASASPAGV